MEIHLFRSEAATASHLDSKIQSDPWVTPLPHSTKNKKKQVFGFFPLPSSGPTLFLDIPPAQGPTNPAVSQLLMFKKPHLGISGGLFCDLSSLFTRCWSVHRSHFAFVPSNFASGHPSRFQSLCSLPSSLFFLCSLPSLLAAVAVGCRMPLLLLSCLLPDRFSLFSALFPLLS